MTAAAAAPDWPIEALRALVQAAWPGMRAQVLDEVDSTNTRLLDALRGGDATPRLLAAKTQTRGRGRNGRDWQSSAAGASAGALMFSLGLSFAPVDWSGLSLAVGVAVADAIEPLTDGRSPRLLIKWPNDLWLADDSAPRGGRKLAGILIETVGMGRRAGGRRGAVIGVGVNVWPRAENVEGVEGVEAAAMSSGYACVRELDAARDAPDAPALLARVAPPLLAALRRFERAGLAPFAAGFARRDLLYGRAVVTTQADLPAGTAIGIDASGALRLSTAAGERRVSSGEVSVRPVAAPGGAPEA